MSSVLYQTFYPYNKFDDIQYITHLNKWMLSKEVLAKLFNDNCYNKNNNDIVKIDKIEKNIVSEQNVIMVAPSIVPKQSQFVIPEKSDTLFWCIYISHFGEQDYLAIGNKYGNAEISEKQKIVEFLKSNKNSLKNIHRKITQSAFKEIMSDLMTNSKTSLLSLVALSVYYKKNILLLNTINKTYLEYRYDDQSILNNENNIELGQWIVLKYCENKKYGFFTESMADVSSLISQYNYIYEPNKPLKGISTYKMGELNVIASKIYELAKEPKMSKPDLYGKIWHNLLWV